MALGAEVARQRILLCFRRLALRGAQQVQLVFAAVEHHVVVEVVVIVLTVEQPVHVVVAGALQLGQVLVDALHIVVQVLQELVDGLHAIGQIAQQADDAGHQLAVGAAGVERHALHQALQESNLLAEIFHNCTSVHRNSIVRGSGFIQSDTIRPMKSVSSA